jgi:hypothetical protein
MGVPLITFRRAKLNGSAARAIISRQFGNHPTFFPDPVAPATALFRHRAVSTTCETAREIIYAALL